MNDLTERLSDCLEEFQESIKYYTRLYIKIKDRPEVANKHKTHIKDAIIILAKDYDKYKKKHDNNNFTEEDVLSLCFKSEHLLYLPDYIQEHIRGT